MSKWIITGQSRTTAAQVVLSTLTERGLDGFGLSNDVRLGELAKLASIELWLQPFPEGDC